MPTDWTGCLTSAKAWLRSPAPIPARAAVSWVRAGPRLRRSQPDRVGPVVVVVARDDHVVGPVFRHLEPGRRVVAPRALGHDPAVRVDHPSHDAAGSRFPVR